MLEAVLSLLNAQAPQALRRRGLAGLMGALLLWQLAVLLLLALGLATGFRLTAAPLWLPWGLLGFALAGYLGLQVLGQRLRKTPKATTVAGLAFLESANLLFGGVMALLCAEAGSLALALVLALGVLALYGWGYLRLAAKL